MVPLWSWRNGGGSTPYPMTRAMTAGGLSGVLQRSIVEMGGDGGCGGAPVSEQVTRGGQPDAVHDVPRGPGVAAVVDAKAG